ncbi:DUF3553 domain-containing protein [Paracoccus kondratievae]|uniref:DUF3553 domain-containing protein n=1 Tax=Paracoccus kondratievae TaxID=135740 RepID=A0AAD3RUP0_9RHOB|nr:MULTISPECIES: DUF3553 domain-containing protein [Paracoccus]QFQ89245.1 DUF3553 domain-containing protein [Paracoccus kondratievae]GLK65042.1 DUF3553 domain-containing protein [Paracoccus kondratievae]SMG34734.1 Protein of unknown function [Paracoccus sp. J56]
MNEILEPGMIVRHPGAPEWGTGQVQSRIGDRITINFANAGKQVVNGKHIHLELVTTDPFDQ